MPQRPRHDRYGKPLPTLAPAPRQDLCHSDQNLRMRRFLLGVLEDAFQDLLRRGVFAEATVLVRIKDGTLQPEVDLGVQHHHVAGPDREDDTLHGRSG